MKKLSKFFAMLLAFVTVFSFSAAAQAASVSDEGELKATAQTSVIPIIPITPITTPTITNPTTTIDYIKKNPSWSIAELTRTAVKINVTNPNHDYTRIFIYNYKKKLVKAKNVSSSASYGIIDGLSKNNLYYYRVRFIDYDYDLGKHVYSSGYSKYTPFVTATASAALVSSGVKIYTPKVNGVKSWKVYISETSKGGYKKIKTVTAGNSFTISKFNGKSLQRYKYYYVRLLSNNGEKSSPWYAFMIKYR